MSVYNAVGEGPLSPPQEVFVGEAGMYCTFPVITINTGLGVKLFGCYFLGKPDVLKPGGL